MEPVSKEQRAADIRMIQRFYPFATMQYGRMYFLPAGVLVGAVAVLIYLWPRLHLHL